MKMKFFDWLRGTAKNIEKDILELTESMKVTVEVKKKTEDFVDEETGKVYKTAGALKGAQTRRRNKEAAEKSKNKGA